MQRADLPQLQAVLLGESTGLLEGVPGRGQRRRPSRPADDLQGLTGHPWTPDAVAACTAAVASRAAETGSPVPIASWAANAPRKGLKKGAGDGGRLADIAERSLERFQATVTLRS